jgi:hypothetical protein
MRTRDMGNRTQDPDDRRAVWAEDSIQLTSECHGGSQHKGCCTERRIVRNQI